MQLHPKAMHLFRREHSRANAWSLNWERPTVCTYRAERGESAELTFPAPPETAGMTRTVILASKGYYRPTPRSSGAPDTETLFQIFMVPDGMARYAAQQFAAMRAAAGVTD